MSEPSPELRQRVLDAARRTPAKTRAAWLAGWRLSLGSAALLLVGVTLWRGVRHFTEAQPFTLWVLVALGGWSFYCMRVVATFARTPLGPSRESLRRVARVTPLVLGAGLWSAVEVTASLADKAATTPSMAHLACGVLGLTAGVIVSLLVLRPLRGAAPGTPLAAASAVGALAGGLSCLAVTLACEHRDLGHMLGSHFVAACLAIAVTALLGRRVVRPAMRDSVQTK